MDAIEPNWRALIVFAAAWTVTCVGLFYLSGALPLKRVPTAPRQPLAQLVVVFNLALFTLLAAFTLLLGALELRWTSIVIAGGFIFLFTPLVVQRFPASLENTRLGHGLLFGTGGLGLSLLILFSDLALTEG